MEGFIATEKKINNELRERTRRHLKIINNQEPTEEQLDALEGTADDLFTNAIMTSKVSHTLPCQTVNMRRGGCVVENRLHPIASESCSMCRLFLEMIPLGYLNPNSLTHRPIYNWLGV